MAEPKYRPAAFATAHRLFGRSRDVEFPAGKGLKHNSRVLASDMQHHYAMRIRDSIIRKGWTVAQYAGAANVTADHMHKLLRGEAILKLEDIAMADLLVGDVSEFARQGELPDLTVAEATKLHIAEHLRMGRLGPRERPLPKQRRSEYTLMYQ